MVDGQTLQGGQRKADKVWVNEEQGIVYSLTGSGANTYLLVKNKKSGHIIARIRNWTNGQLGLSMTDKAPDPQPGPGGTQSGLGLDQSGTSGYIHIKQARPTKASPLQATASPILLLAPTMTTTSAQETAMATTSWLAAAATW